MKILRVFMCFYLLHIAFGHVSIIEKAADLADNAFIEHFVTSVAWCENDPDDVEIFVKRYQGAVVLTSILNITTDMIQAIHRIKGYQQTVFLASTADEFVYFLKALKQYLVVPIRLILVLTKFVPDQDLTRLIKSAWENDFANLLIVSSDDKGNITLKTYFPFSAGSCNNSSIVTLDDTQDLFPKKFYNFYGCEVRTTLIDMAPYNKIEFEHNNSVSSISGIDADVFNLLFKVVNANVKFVSAMKHGSMGMMINGTVTGCLGELVNETADVFCPAGVMTANRYSLVQISYVFETANVFWFGPRRREINEWLRVLQPFTTQVTPALLTSFLVFIVTVMVIRRFGLHRSYSKDSVLFQSFVVFMGQIVKLEASSWLINSLFLLWIWFCMVVRIAYQCDLVDGMQKTIFETPLENFNIALKQVDGYGGVEIFRDYVSGTPYYKDYENIEFLDVPQYLKKMAAGKRFLILTDRLIAFDASRRVQKLGKDPVTQVPVCFYMRPGWPPAEVVNVILLRLIESGFIDEIHSHYFVQRRRSHYNDHRDARPLTMDTLIGCFYVLGVLYTICIIVFIFEIIYYKKYGQKKPLTSENIMRLNHLI